MTEASGEPFRHLVVMRHAMAEPEGSGGDFSRRLTELGRRDARSVADRLVVSGFVPEWMLVSEAARTRETGVHLIGQWTAVPRVVGEARLYLAGASRVADVVADAPDEVRHLLVLGHNPGLEDFVERLTGAQPSLGTACAVHLTHTTRLPWARAVHLEDWNRRAYLKP